MAAPVASMREAGIRLPSKGWPVNGSNDRDAAGREIAGALGRGRHVGQARLGGAVVDAFDAAKKKPRSSGAGPPSVPPN